MRFETHFQAGDRLYHSQSTCNGTALERSCCCDTIFGTIKCNNNRNQRTSLQCPNVNSCNIRRELTDCQNNGSASKNPRRYVRVFARYNSSSNDTKRGVEKIITIWLRILVVGIITIMKSHIHS